MSKQCPAACFLGLFVLLGLPSSLTAGLGTDTGEEVGYWNTHSVIFAEVTEVERLPSEKYPHGTHRLQVRPQATLTGSFDAARYPTLELGGWFQAFDCVCYTPPTTGRNIVAVIHKRDGEYFIESSILTFMPKGAGVVEVKDFSDPLVAKIMNNLKALRRNFPF